MLTKPYFIKTKVRQLAWIIFNKLENNNNVDFYTNGEELFINNLFNTFRLKNAKRIIFDIGANIGNYTEMLLLRAENTGININIHLFEPTKDCYTVLHEKFKNNNNIILNNFGVSNKNCTEKIYYNKEKSGLASLYKRNLDSYNIKMDKSEKVRLKRLDNYIREKNIDHIDFIKIDIEGHELKALEGFGNFLHKDFIDFIQFEYGGANLDSHVSLMEIYEYLEKRDFVIAKVMPKGLEIRKYQPLMDNFIYANYVAISKRVIL